jgi:glycosyltransferase involved in cell wall biosynthesis
LLGNEKVYFIPHGVDIDAFKPGSELQRSNTRFNCIFVGKHLRDIAVMERIVSDAEQRNPKIHFHIISDPTTLLLFQDKQNVSTYHKVSDDKLISLYQTADAMVLPLLDATANNSILEAIACGLPVITTDIVGTRDYLNDACAVFVPQDKPEAFLPHIEGLMRHPDKCVQMSKASRKRACELSWPIVARKFEELYLQVTRI